ncbi:flagellar basal body-associated protein FliL [Celerinatantimonas sp. YJH-8]|uniref:flagellar basal body-associated protein FliL n=1 Tax=Celerinatantimonas sp. YJH-8 TaxID=3228714 RepID=UPI0038C9E45E
MNQFLRILIVVLIGWFSTATVQAADEPQNQDSYAYFGFEPDIITNYIKAGRTLGYIRLSVELRVKHQSRLADVEHNSPLLRDAIIKIFGSQDEPQIRSLTGREKIREQCLSTVNDLLFQETGEKDLVDDLLFTKYLYQ